MQARLAPFLERHDDSDAANEIVDAERHEIDLYERFSHLSATASTSPPETTD